MKTVISDVKITLIPDNDPLIVSSTQALIMNSSKEVFDLAVAIEQERCDPIIVYKTVYWEDWTETEKSGIEPPPVDQYIIYAPLRIQEAFGIIYSDFNKINKDNCSLKLRLDTFRKSSWLMRVWMAMRNKL
jgi:hypothetical protein